jgi:signal peptidase I
MLENKTKEKVKNKVKLKSKVYEYAEAIIIAILIAVVIRTFVVQAYKIPSRSMVPTLLVGDHILVNKFIYGVKVPFLRNTIIPVTNPQRGDIVVFIYPNDRSKDYIKRVIGLGGDKIEIKNKIIFINGKKYSDVYGIYSDNVIYPGSMQPRDNFGPVTVPVKSLFVMGDNRDESADSRFWGFVDLRDVEGKAFIIYFSLNYEEKNLRWQRLGNILR